MTVLIGDELERQILGEIEDAHRAVRDAIILGLQLWTSVGKLYVADMEREARETVRELRRQLEYVRNRSRPTSPPEPPLLVGQQQLELFAGMPPLPARRRRTRRFRPPSR